MDPRVLRSLWPIFAAETREQLQTIGAAVLGLEQGTAEQASEQLIALKREVHSLKGSAASLGLGDIEQLVHAIEDGLARCSPGHVPPPGLVESTLRSLSAIESALNRGDTGEPPVIENLGGLLAGLGHGGLETSADTKTKVPAHFKRESLQSLEKLETALGRLCSPGLADRQGAVWEAVGLAELMKAAASTVGLPAVESLAGSIRAGFARMEESGVGASVAASDVAGALVQLRGSLEALTEEMPAEPVAAPPEPEVMARSAAGGGRRQADMDRAVRVSVRTLDSLALQVEQLAAGRAQQLRRAEAHRELMEQTNHALLQLERAAQQLALSGGGGGALETLRAGVGQVRGVQKRLLQLSKDVHREGEQLALVAQVVRDDLRDLRMVPASQMLEPLKRTVRELAARLGKDVELGLAGGDVRIDRRIVDVLKDPLQHLVRNALDHGLEPTAERVPGRQVGARQPVGAGGAAGHAPVGGGGG